MKRESLDIPLNILIMDDDDSVRAVLKEILISQNHIVSEAKGGIEGIKKFKDAKYDVVFTDLSMPGMNGFETAKAIKGINPDIPVILVTGWGSETDEKKLRENGIDYRISKPYKYKEVLDILLLVTKRT